MKPSNQLPLKKTKSTSLKIILISLLAFIALLIIAAFVTAITSSPEEKKAREERIKENDRQEQIENEAEKAKELREKEEINKKQYTKIDALIQSRVYIQNKLRSPGSAEFDSSIDGVKQINDTTFTVSSYVDSQNGFGALLRSEYSLKIIFHPSEDTHDVKDIILK